MNNLNIKRALLSVSDKSGLEEIARFLQVKEVELIASGGTGKFLTELGFVWTPVESITGNPEAFDGRMKTLSFQISSSLLYKRESEKDRKQAEALGIKPIDLVICNLYPFRETAKQTKEIQELVEKIDIGGPTMIRAAAKNYNDVLVLVSPKQYASFMNEYTATGIDFNYRKKAAATAFRHTSDYELFIANTLSAELNKEDFYPYFSTETYQGLRYGENPHQKAVVIADDRFETSLAKVKPLQGKELSYNNLLDADAAYRSNCDLHRKFSDKNIVTIIKHSNPCGAAICVEQFETLQTAWAADPISSFGSIICFNQKLEKECAVFLNERFVEVVIAPEYSDEAMEIFRMKKNLRLIKLAPRDYYLGETMVRSIDGGFLIQEEDKEISKEYLVKTEKTNVTNDLGLLDFGVFVTKHFKSNAITLVGKNDKGYFLAGAGMGNPNRLISVIQAVDKAKENNYATDKLVLVSDAFFPFRDSIDHIHQFGIQAIVQPGGSIRDEEVITACNENNISMCFTNRRHFRH